MSTEHADFPKLMWLPDGREVTANNADDEARYVADGARWTAAPEAPVDSTPRVAEPASAPPTFGPADEGTGEGPTFGASTAVDTAPPRRSARKSSAQTKTAPKPSARKKK